MAEKQIIKVMIVDDSRLMRAYLADRINAQGDMQVTAAVGNGREAAEALEHGDLPDVITLDVEMPVMDGLTFLKNYRDKYPDIPVLMFSVQTESGAEATFKALDLGAWDFVHKPSRFDPKSNLDDGEILEKIRSFGAAKIVLENRPSRPRSPSIIQSQRRQALAKGKQPQVVVIGCSTGGPAALSEILPQLPADFALPVLIVQHMPAGFTRQFAERLNMRSAITVREAEDGDVIQGGHVYIAPGSAHIQIMSKGSKKIIQCRSDIPPRNNHMPSVDILFESVADVYGPACIAIILTGMGRDGVTGIKKLHSAGAHTIGQDEQTSVIYGMNKRAKNEGALVNELPLTQIIPNVIQFVSQQTP